MVTPTEKVQEGEPAIVEIESPHGVPITYDVDMGDGNTITVTVPEIDIESTTPFTLYTPGGNILAEGEGSGEADQGSQNGTSSF